MRQGTQEIWDFERNHVDWQVLGATIKSTVLIIIMALIFVLGWPLE